MPTTDSLAAVLSDFARTMLTSFPIRGILDHLVRRIVEVLPVTGAGVTLISPGTAPRYITASNADALRFEQLQSALNQGPCLTAFESGVPVFVPDLARDSRYPEFGPAALDAGMAAVFTFPLRHDDGLLGALDLYRDVAGPLDAQAQIAAQTLADVATAYLLTAQARAEAQRSADWYRELALHDSLTGLPNRVLLKERLEHASQSARRSRSVAVVLFVDLDNVRRVSDVYGHRVADELLIAVAQRLTALVRPGDTLARIAGEEFVFLCEDLARAADVDLLVERINEAFTTPFVLTNVELALTASVGIAYAGPGQDLTDELVADADLAMYRARRRGRASHQVIDLRISSDAQENDQLERDLHSALAGAHLDVAYQPIVRTTDGLILGVEALLRWTHPTRGSIPALTAVTLAEQSGLIADIGAWVLERACRDRVGWLAEHPDHPVTLSVNVSPLQLMSPGFAGRVSAVLQATGMDPRALVLEVTEGLLVEDSDRAMRVLDDLKGLGARLALDDFGTGYCSLSYLQKFPIDIVKIDQTFVSSIGADRTAAAIVASVTDLSHALGMTVTAEGVETTTQRDEVARVGCDHSQGFLFHKPMPASGLSAQLS